MKTISRLWGVVGASLLLAACGGSSASNESPPENGNPWGNFDAKFAGTYSGTLTFDRGGFGTFGSRESYRIVLTVAQDGGSITVSPVCLSSGQEVTVPAIGAITALGDLSVICPPAAVGGYSDLIVKLDRVFMAVADDRGLWAQFNFTAWSQAGKGSDTFEGRMTFGPGKKVSN